MQTIKSIPPQWETARREVERMANSTRWAGASDLRYHRAIIAGGCLRDLMLGIPVNDIDIFLTNMTVQEAISTFGAERINEYGQEEDTGEVARHKHISVQGLDVDLVFQSAESAADVIARFDFGICQIAWDGTNLTMSDQFLKDVQNRTYTRLPGAIAYANHQERLHDKLTRYGYGYSELSDECPF